MGLTARTASAILSVGLMPSATHPFRTPAGAVGLSPSPLQRLGFGDRSFSVGGTLTRNSFYVLWKYLHSHLAVQSKRSFWHADNSLESAACGFLVQLIEINNRPALQLDRKGHRVAVWGMGQDFSLQNLW